MYVEEKNKHLPEKKNQTKTKNHKTKSLHPCSGDLLLHYVVVKRAVSYRTIFYSFSFKVM